jgi:hypothetical protein
MYALPSRCPVKCCIVCAGVLCLVVCLVGGCSSSQWRNPAPTSWNEHIATRPVITTISDIVGSRTNSLGGATREGGWHGGISLADRRRYVGRQQVGGDDQRRLVPPPDTVDGVPVFVEVDKVEIVWLYDNGGVPGTDHDTSGNACMVGRPRSNLTCIHVEIDGEWKARGWAPENFPMNVPIDMQGYIYWDVPHAEEGVPYDSAPSDFILGHYATGWEIHPVSAWRRHYG